MDDATPRYATMDMISTFLFIFYYSIIAKSKINSSHACTATHANAHTDQDG